MNPSFARTLLFLRGLVPAATLVVAVVLAVLPLGIPGLRIVTPFLALAAVYFWSIYRPELVPVWAAFLAGLLQDLLIGSPIGLTALVLVLVRALAASQRRTVLGQSFGVEWAGFLLVAAGAGAAGWLLACVYDGALLPAVPFAVQWLLTSALYPVGSWLLGQTARVSRPMRAA